MQLFVHLKRTKLRHRHSVLVLDGGASGGVDGHHGGRDRSRRRRRNQPHPQAPELDAVQLAQHACSRRQVQVIRLLWQWVSFSLIFFSLLVLSLFLKEKMVWVVVVYFFLRFYSLLWLPLRNYTYMRTYMLAMTRADSGHYVYFLCSVKVSITGQLLHKKNVVIL